MSDEAITLRTGIMLRDGKCQGEEILEAFVLALKAEGIVVGGVYQRTQHRNAARKQMVLVDALTDEIIPISQDLGVGSGACVLDADGLASGAMAVGRAIERRVDLLVVNKFSSRECDGKGLAPELFMAMAEGMAVLTTVSERYIERWTEMSGGLGTILAADETALRAWWDKARSPELTQ